MHHIKEIIQEYCSIPLSTSIKISFLGGMTNKNYLATISKDEQLVVRIPGIMTENLINRNNEAKNSLLMSKQGLNVKTYFFDAQSGIKITKYLNNSQTLDHQSIKDFSNLRLIAQQLKILHSSSVQFENKFNLFSEFDKYLSLLKNKSSFYHYNDDMPTLLLFWDNVREYLLNQKHYVAPCHNDLVPENILRKENTIYFIDWEYSGMNDPMFDIAALFIEAKLNHNEQLFFLENYFEHVENIKEEYKRIELYKFAQDILWFIWTLVKEENGENFGDYSQRRLHRAINFMKKHKDLYFNQ